MENQIPQLICMAGPKVGELIPLDGEVSIGRSYSNSFCINDVKVSKQHCVIKEMEGQRFELTDLGSRNGTFVNEVPIKVRLLEHGDIIRVGSSLIIFLLDAEEGMSTFNEVQLQSGGISLCSTVQLRPEDSLYLQPEKLLAASPAMSREARDLQTILKIGTVVNSCRGLESLQRQMLEMILEVVPAERGAIILVRDSEEVLTSSFGLDRHPELREKIQVSRTIISRVLQDKVAILSNDVIGSGAFDDVESLMSIRLSSLLAVPVLLYEKFLGVIYLDTKDPDARFDEGHLQLVTGIAGIAAGPLDSARHVEWLEQENRRLHREIDLEHDMIGDSDRMRDVYQVIKRVAPSDMTVLILGESGTGKELAARAIHNNSPRAKKPFVAINCAALTETLLESELFGHEKGSFTGAIAQKKGKLEVADGGTVFLDEVGELTPAMQAKLLRVLQEREFERIGGIRPIRVNIRVVAATNRELKEVVKAGKFRQDLYYRLNVVSLTMPPLRERREDILLLANYFAVKYGKECKRQLKGISSAAQAVLSAYEWPGNVRELENAIERAVVLGSNDYIMREDLPLAESASESPAAATALTFFEAVDEAKKQIILRAVEQSSWNYTQAAKSLGVYPTYLHRLIRNLGLTSQLKGINSKKSGEQ
jgi:Nif-specific regulatory protein